MMDKHALVVNPYLSLYATISIDGMGAVVRIRVHASG